MGWVGKVLGGAIGGIIGGPVGIAAGAGLGHLFDAETETGQANVAVPEPRVTLGELWTETDLAPGGPGLVIKVAASFHAAVQGAVVLFRFEGGDGYIRARHASYADPDGDLTLPGAVRQQSNGAIFALTFLPYAALPPRTRRDVTCEAVVFDGSGNRAGHATWNLRLPAKSERQQNALSALARAGVALAYASGGLSREEVRIMRERLAGWFELDEVGLESLRESLNAAKDDPPSLEDAAAPFRGAEPDVCEGVFAFLVEVATIDGVFEESERAFLVAFGRMLPIDEDRILDALGDTERGQLDQCCQALELEPGAEWTEVKKAYRRLAGEYHPDKVATLPKDFQQYATDKMKAINAAYAALRAALADQGFRVRT
jgi:DnaJ-domain-containing protein 1